MADMFVSAYRKQQEYVCLVSLTMKTTNKKNLLTFKKMLKNKVKTQKQQKLINFNPVKIRLSKAKNNPRKEQFN